MCGRQQEVIFKSDKKNKTKEVCVHHNKGNVNQCSGVSHVY